MNRMTSGRLGEDQAAAFLLAKGYKILERNYRAGRWGELDIVCEEAGDLVFVEVKARKSTNYSQAVEAVSWGKRHRLLRAAQQYKFAHPQTPASMRFDVITIALDSSGKLVHKDLYKNIDA
jgi:putative endonuclease